jgi:hypothetical protein
MDSVRKAQGRSSSRWIPLGRGWAGLASGSFLQVGRGRSDPTCIASVREWLEVVPDIFRHVWRLGVGPNCIPLGEGKRVASDQSVRGRGRIFRLVYSGRECLQMDSVR